MNFLKRAIKSIVRQKGKSLILFILLFVLGNLIAGAVAIQQSTRHVEVGTKKKLGTKVTITTDYLAYQADNPEDNGANAPQRLKLADFKKIAALKYVANSDYIYNGGFASEKLKSVQEEPSEKEGQSFVGGGMAEEEGAYFLMQGATKPQFQALADKKVKLKSGRTFTQEELDSKKAVALVSQKFADLNGISVGKTLVMDSVSGTYSESGEMTNKQVEETPVEVIGIFEVANPDVDKTAKSKKDASADPYIKAMEHNTVFVPNDMALDSIKQQYNQALEMMSESEKESSGILNEDPADMFEGVINLKSPDDLKAFKEAAKPYLPKYSKLEAQADEYEKVAGSLTSLNKISNYVLIVASIATVLIVTLLVLLFLRDRKKELGIYLSMGETRSKIIGQVLIEMLGIATIALLLALVTGYFVSGTLSDVLLQSDLLAQPKTNSAVEDMLNTGMNAGPFSTAVSLDASDVHSAYQVKFTPQYAASFLGLGLVTVLLAALMPLLYILRLNPKKIML